MVREYSYENDKNTFLTPHFQVWEFCSYSDAENRLTTDKILIDETLPILLERIFDKLNCSIIKITSGYRSDDFDQAIGGFLGYHSKGMAADIICYNQDNSLIPSKDVCLVAEDLKILGIGYGGNYTHIDTRDYKSYFDETNGYTDIDSFYNYFSVKKQEPERTEEDTVYKIGDEVEIDGVYISSIDENIMTPLVNVGTITRVVQGTRNPYLLNDGNIGWVNNDCIVKKLDNKSINVGDKVRVKQAIQYNGKPFITYYDLYDVIEVNGNRVVIGIGTTTTCAVNINNIEKI